MTKLWTVLCVTAIASCATLDPETPQPDLPLGWEEGEPAAERASRVGLNFSQGALIPGVPIPFTVTGAAPTDTVHFLFTTTGTGAGPCIAQLGGLCVDLLAPLTILGTATADSAGIATMDVMLPVGAPQVFIFTQAVVDRGMVGSVASNTITAPVLAGHLDVDGDGYCGGATCADQASLPGDCQDDDPLVNPGITTPEAVPYWNGAYYSFDYDCDGVETLTRTDEYDCMTDGGGIFSCPNQPGWEFGVPGCGQTDLWGDGCIEFAFLCFASSSQYETQTCL